MTYEDVLTKEIAEDPGFFLLDQFLKLFTTIEDAAAESFGKHKGDLLRLSGLTSLSDAAAEGISKYEGKLALNGLTRLSNTAAESLSKFKGRVLYLHGLISLSVVAAESLSKHEGPLLDKWRRQVKLRQKMR